MYILYYYQFIKKNQSEIVLKAKYLTSTYDLDCN